MNRHQRRAALAGGPGGGKRFVAKCQMCAAKTCVIHVLMRHGQKDLGICKGCPCAAGKCDACGETGQHWLGCTSVGVPEQPSGTVQ